MKILYLEMPALIKRKSNVRPSSQDAAWDGGNLMGETSFGPHYVL
jgi:hypothetical protein